jgi:hypothetical protein
MAAGRDISCTHAALSSTRVMGTCSALGQAVGMAAVLAVQKGLLPRGMNAHIEELQQMLIADDCYLPWVEQNYTALTLKADLSASRGDPSPVRDGLNRPVDDVEHRWLCHKGDHLAYRFDGERAIEQVTLVLDSALDKNVAMSYHQRDDQLTHVPDVMPKTFRIETLGSDGAWHTLHRVQNNYQRLVRVPVGRATQGIRFVLEETWGSETTNIYAFYIS